MSSLEEERIRYQPAFPQILNQIERLEPVKAGDIKIKEKESILSLFPNTGNRQIVHFKENKDRKHSSLRVGVVLSGGQAPGGHNVIIGLFDALKKLNPQSRLFGFLGGPSGIIENRYHELNQEFLSGFRNTGGFDMIGSGRAKIETPQQFEAALRNCSSLNLDGLVIIGGDDSNTNAALLAEYFITHHCRTHVVGVPKTIDGDLKNEHLEISFGFDTACKIYSEMIGNLGKDALSAKKYTHFIKLMGRSASHIALECALQTHPNVTLIGEEIAAGKMTLMQITDTICACIAKRAEQGKGYAIILIPEGLIEFVPEMKALIQELNSLLAQSEKNVIEKLSRHAAATLNYLPTEIGKQLLLDRDPHGNVQLSQIATEQLLIHSVKNSLKNWPGYKGKFSPVGHFFGYEGRCGYPSNFDANYCYSLGFVAALLVCHGMNGYMSTLQRLAEPASEWRIAGIPLTSMMDIEERQGKKRPVIQKALVDLEGEPFKLFTAHRDAWALEDHYCSPGPIQFAGPPNLCNETTYTLRLEQHKRIVQFNRP